LFALYYLNPAQSYPQNGYIMGTENESAFAVFVVTSLIEQPRSPTVGVPLVACESRAFRLLGR